jgi:hypothetical protein
MTESESKLETKISELKRGRGRGGRNGGPHGGRSALQTRAPLASTRRGIGFLAENKRESPASENGISVDGERGGQSEGRGYRVGNRSGGRGRSGGRRNQTRYTGRGRGRARENKEVIPPFRSDCNTTIESHILLEQTNEYEPNDDDYLQNEQEIEKMVEQLVIEDDDFSVPETTVDPERLIIEDVDMPETKVKVELPQVDWLGTMHSTRVNQTHMTTLLPSLSSTVSKGSTNGVPMILGRNFHPSAVEDAVASNDSIVAEKSTSSLPTEIAAVTKKSKKVHTKKKKEVTIQVQAIPLPEELPLVTTTDALKKLPPRQVSITAATQVTVKESSTYPTHSDTTSTKHATKASKNKKKKGLSSDQAVNEKAARKFNSQVRACVEQSDLPAIRGILHDKDNHNFALDNNVLEIVMQAFMHAALFDDALYCLRNCTLPGTLSTTQTERILVCLPQNLRNSSAFTAADMINALCIATEFSKPTLRTYFLRIVRGIALEFLEEATSARDRICSAPCERLVRSGLCVVDSRLLRGKKPTELIVRPGDQLCFVPDSSEQRGIAAGDAVSILPFSGPYPYSSESLDRNMIEATVINTNPMVLRLQDKMNASLHTQLTEAVEGNVYRIDKLANRMGFNRQLAAAVAVAGPNNSKTRDVRRPCPQLTHAISSMDESIMRQTCGGLHRGEMTSTAAICSETIPWSVEEEGDTFDPESQRYASRLALEKYGALEGLNASQKLAVEGATTNRLTLVQGPPGTGSF